MRLRSVVFSLLVAMALAGCSYSSGLEDMLPPSNEVTNAIRPSAPVPAREVAARDVPTEAEIAEIEEAPSQVALATEPKVAVPSQRPEPELQAMALVPPAKLPAMAMTIPARPAVLSRPSRVGEIHRQRFRDAKPINFGRSSPRHLAVHGVDVSRWQGEIDWVKLRSQGANFAYIKATDGGDHLDPLFRKNWREAKQAGLKRGAYHFFYWCRAASEQADWFIRNVPREAGALPPVIDVEWNGESRCKKRPSRARVLEKMQVFMDKLERHYGQRPIIYTAPDFYADNLEGAFLDYPFWLRSVARHPSKVYPGRDWVFWQYSGSGLSHGVKGKIDLNVFHGTESQWRRWVAAHTAGSS
ncbi:glycoside hydrolase family 25 protein [Mesorhizobium sp. 1B3]|uniref:glycoside hydrolase family 25 protein n=1 Tax=Mesorhizobium sp. 1B3 TaxID=3243599 RepID=UPI003D980BC7